MKTLLWLDDCRDPLDGEVDWMVFSCLGRDCNVVWAKSYDEFTFWVKENGLPDGVNFDHDLGGDEVKEKVANGMSKRQAKRERRGTPTGYDCAKWLVDYCIDNGFQLPLWYTHSANPVGRENIELYLRNAKKHLDL
jgi:hypothetical protein